MALSPSASPIPQVWRGPGSRRSSMVRDPAQRPGDALGLSAPQWRIHPCGPFSPRPKAVGKKSPTKEASRFCIFRLKTFLPWGRDAKIPAGAFAQGQPRRHAQAFSRFRGAVCKFPPQFFGCGSYGTGSGDSRDQRTASNLHGDPRYDPHLLPES